MRKRATTIFQNAVKALKQKVSVKILKTDTLKYIHIQCYHIHYLLYYVTFDVEHCLQRDIFKLVHVIWSDQLFQDRNNNSISSTLQKVNS